MKKKKNDLTRPNLHNSAQYAMTKKIKMNTDQWDRFKILWARFKMNQMLTPKKDLCLRKATGKTG